MEYYRPIGPLSAAQAIREMRIQDNDYAESRLLVDLRLADLTSIKTAELIEFAKLVAAKCDASPCRSAKVGIVAVDDLTFGLANIVRGNAVTKVGKLEIKVVREDTPVLEWLEAS